MKGHPMDILEQILPTSHPVLGRLLKAKPVGKWMAIGSVYTGPQSPFAGVWNIGDASGIIDPFTGLGMSLALQGGRFIGETLGVDKEHSIQDLKRNLNKKRFITTAILRNILFRPSLCHLVVKYGSLFPRLGKTIIKQLHG